MILNLTQHNATPAQAEAGVGDPSPSMRGLLTIEREILVADEVLRAQILDARVEAILGVLFRHLAELAVGRSIRGTEAACEGRLMDAWNISREPLCQAMVGGAPYLVDRLVRRLKELGVEPVYALSERVSKETVGSDGVVTKTQVFEHLGFIRA